MTLLIIAIVAGIALFAAEICLSVEDPHDAAVPAWFQRERREEL